MNLRDGVRKKNLKKRNVTHLFDPILQFFSVKETVYSVVVVGGGAVVLLAFEMICLGWESV